MLIATLKLDASEKVDVIDAHVAWLTIKTKAIVYTSDRTDLARYGVDKKMIRFV